MHVPQIRKLKRYLRFKWQRKTRGWDDSELWNLDITLAQFLAPRLRRLTEITYSYPPNMTFEAWKGILLEMAEGFEIYQHKFDFGHELSLKDYEKVQRSLELLAKYFTHLWD